MMQANPMLRRSIAMIGLAAASFSSPLFAADSAAQPMSPAVSPTVPDVATPLPLGAVRLTGGPLKAAQDADADYLLKLEPDRMLAYFRERAGLEPKAKPYGGWDGSGRALTGHIAGHYLSAISLMYQATGDTRFKERADYLVSELKAVQDKRGTGYVGALLGDADRRGNASASVNDNKPLLDGELLFDRLAEGRIESGGFDLNGMWSPWYVQHKIYAGLRDAYRYTGNKTALDVETKFAAWAEKLVGNFTDEQAQKMLTTEFGGMNEIFVDLYADTGDKRWLKLADKFDHKVIVKPLSEGRDELGGTHGNTQIPKLLGSASEYAATGNAAAGEAARNFWTYVVHDHSFATGGHGYDEYFGPPDKLSGQVDGTGQRSRSLRTAESCNVYNMLKLTRRLFALKPAAEYAAFQERALFNHVLASIDPATGRTCYMVPVGAGVQHEYQRMFEDFTCCVGSGMESHALHGDGLYFTAADRLWVNLYTPSTADWQAAGVRLETVTTETAGGVATLRLSLKQPKSFTLSLRRPAWAGGAFSIAINGKAVENAGKPGEFVDVKRDWNDGDVVTVNLPMSLRAEPLPDNPARVALMWGPLVLAGDFGPEMRERGDDKSATAHADFPVFPYGDKPLTEWLTPVDGKPATFRATTAQGKEITLSPFYALHDRRYGLYWDVYTPQQWVERKAKYDAEQERQRQVALATVAFVQLGQMQPERDFNYQGDAASKTIRVDDNPGRRGGAWMTFDVPLNAAVPVAIEITTLRETPNTAVRPTIETVPLADPQSTDEAETKFKTLKFAVPETAVHGKTRLTVRLDAAEGGALPAVFGVRVIRSTNTPPTP